MMKWTLSVAFTLLAPVASATAEIGSANSTNQHQRDSASFYGRVPELGARIGKLNGADEADREAANSRTP